MKKLLSLLLALILVFGLVACGTKKEETKPAEEKKQEETKPAEDKKEEKKDEKTSETKPTESKEIAKVGLGFDVELSGKAGRKENFEAQQNAVFAVVSFDKDGKIVNAQIDNAQSKFTFTKEGKYEVKPEEATFKTKKELGEDYGMRSASGIKKEWFEQMQAFEAYIVGKTAEEVGSIPTAKKDDSHLHVPTEADLVSSVTVDIGQYQAAVLKAWENAQDVQGVVKVGYKAITSMGHGTKESEGQGYQAQFETAVAATGLKEDGTIAVTLLDNAQNTVKFKQDGTVDGELKGTTKKTLGADYKMKDASPIKKEWDEQIKGLEAFVTGKKEADIAGLQLDNGKAKDADLLATTTITISAYQQALVEAIKAAK